MAVFLLAVGTAWGAGNVGAAVPDLGTEFGLTLTAIGLLSGSLFFGFSSAGTLGSPNVIHRIGIIRAMILACGLAALGNLVFAVAESVVLLAVGRAIAGLGIGVAVVAGPVFARGSGGVSLVALFGAAIQLGIAGGLGLGSVLIDSGVDWRMTFVISALVGLSAVPFLLRSPAVDYQPKRGGGFVRLAFRSADVWRLCAMFISIFAIPLILGTWLVHYLSVDNSLDVGTAGILSFVLFGISAGAREVGGKLADRGVSPTLLVGMAPLLAAAGLAILALDDALLFAGLAVVAAGIGFAVPYGPSIIQAQKLYPSDPTEPVALMSLVGTAIPVVLIPVIGTLLDDGAGPEVFLVMAAFVAAAGLLNLRPVRGSLEEPG